MRTLIPPFAKGQARQWSASVDLRDYFGAGRLWGGFGRDVLVVPASVRSEDDPVTGLGELIAAVVVCTTLKAARPEANIQIRFPQEIPGLPEGDVSATEAALGAFDIICFGGSDTNEVTAAALERLSVHEPWLRNSYRLGPQQQEGGRPHIISYRGRTEETVYMQGPRAPDGMVKDFGIFLVRPNCFAEASGVAPRIVLCYGAHTYGTMGAAAILFNHQSAARISRYIKQQSKRRGVPRRQVFESLDGFVTVEPVPEQRADAALMHPYRSVVVEEPEGLRGTRAMNPAVVSDALAYVTGTRRRYEFMTILWRLWLYIAIALVFASVFFRSIALGVLAFALGLVQVLGERYKHTRHYAERL